MKKSFIIHLDSLDVLDELSKDQIADLFGQYGKGKGGSRDGR